MDRRYQAWKVLEARTAPPGVDTDAAARVAQILTEGQYGEFWPHLKSEIDGLIHQAEARFLDALAPDYQAYVQWWSRRQALIAVLAIPDRVSTEVEQRQEATHATG